MILIRNDVCVSQATIIMVLLVNYHLISQRKSRTQPYTVLYFCNGGVACTVCNQIIIMFL